MGKSSIQGLTSSLHRQYVSTLSQLSDMKGVVINLLRMAPNFIIKPSLT